MSSRSTKERIQDIFNVHWYGKEESRVGRKLGHVTVCLAVADALKMDTIVREIEGIWYSGGLDSEFKNDYELG